MVIERRSLLINTEYILYIQMVWLNVENIFNHSENKLEFDMSLCAELDKASNTNDPKCLFLYVLFLIIYIFF